MKRILVLLLALTITLMLVLWRYWQQRRREQNAELKAESKEEGIDLALDILRCIKEKKLTLNQIAEKVGVSLEKVEALAAMA